MNEATGDRTMCRCWNSSAGPFNLIVYLHAQVHHLRPEPPTCGSPLSYLTDLRATWPSVEQVKSATFGSRPRRQLSNVGVRRHLSSHLQFCLLSPLHFGHPSMRPAGVRLRAWLDAFISNILHHVFQKLFETCFYTTAIKRVGTREESQ